MAVSGVFYTLPMFVMQLLIKDVIERFGDDIHPGDIFVSNDPFKAGIHQSDVQFVSPYFHDGEIVAWAGCMAHVMDIGGMNPGSWCPTAIDLYQEGMHHPALANRRAGQDQPRAVGFDHVELAAARHARERLLRVPVVASSGARSVCARRATSTAPTRCARRWR